MFQRSHNLNNARDIPVYPTNTKQTKPFSELGMGYFYCCDEVGITTTHVKILGFTIYDVIFTYLEVGQYTRLFI